MGLGTLAFAYAFVTDPRNRVYHALLTAIAGIAFVAYVAMTFRVGITTPLGRPDGHVVDLARYAQWILATPLIVVYLGLLAGLERRYLVGLVAVDVVVMASGLVGSLVTGVFSWVAFGVGAVAYLPLIYGLTVGIDRAVADRPAPVRALFGKLRNLTLIIWTFYPVLWVLAPSGLGVIDYTTEVVIITYADLIAKVGFGFIAMNSQRSLSELPELDALRSFKLRGE